MWGGKLSFQSQFYYGKGGVYSVLELLIFPAALGVGFGVHKIQNKKNDKRGMIDEVFKVLGVGVKPKKQGDKPKYPKLIKVYPNKWGMRYWYKPPTGMSSRIILNNYPLDIILEDALGTDVDVNNKGGIIQVDVYNERLSTYVDYEEEWIKKCKNYKVVIGTTQHGLVYHSFKDVPHMVIGGMTRYGKSVLMKLIITQLAVTHQSVKFHLVDLKGGLAFNRFKNLPQTHSVSRNVKETLKNLKNLRNDILKRMKWFEEMEWEDVGEAEKAGHYLGRDIIIVDELSVLTPNDKTDKEYQAKLEVRHILEFIAQVAGGLGYNLIVCSQYPTGDILPRTIKQNSDAKIALRLPTEIASKVVLDETGAEELEYGLKGRAIYRTDDKKMIQIPHLTNKQIDEFIKPFKVVKEEHVDDETREDFVEIG